MKVWEATNHFLELLLRYLTDDDACENILRFWLNPIMEERLTSAYGKLDELLEVHKDYPMTTNSQFIKNSKTYRQDKNMEQFNQAVEETGLQPGQKLSLEDFSRLLPSKSLTANLDMDMVAAEEAFDNMNAYYEVSNSFLASKFR